VASSHAATGIASVGNVASAVNVDGNLEVTFNVKVDGVNNDAYTIRRAYVNWDNPAQDLTAYPGATNTFQRDSLTVDADNVSLQAAGAGNYTITVPAANVIANATYLFQLQTAADGTRPVIVAQNGAPHQRDLVSNDGCKKCHGDFVFPNSHYTVAAESCQVCHTRAGRSFSIAEQNEAGEWVNNTEGYGSNLTIYAHGVHNSHHMPAGKAFFHGEEWSVGYPSDMRNCVSCHVTENQLAGAVEAPVSQYLCFSCHQSWDGFVDHDGNALITQESGLIFHRNLAPDANCTVCHDGAVAPAQAADFHTSFASDDAHYNSFYRGVDISFQNPNDVSFEVTGVTKSGNDVTFTWAASKNGVPVDPCNTNIDNGPTFQELGAYLAYAKGDDWVNEGVGTSPGQPQGAKKLFTALATTCADNVATTTGLAVSEGAPYAEKVLLALGGKPQDKHDATGNAFYVRVPSPTFAFSMADGAAAEARRDIVDNTKCTGCHAGTMYQHGGDRIDNAQLCVVCHNPASSDKNNRMSRFQIVNENGSVDTASTYDGKTAQTYDLRYLLHAIHGVGFSETPYVIYRSRGIYSFVTDDMAKPAGWPADGSKAIYGSDNGSEITHNWTVVHYPKPANDCEACHFEGTYEVPDQTKAVALTVDAGTDWADQSDDTVIGPAAAACTSCHNSAPVRSHATTFGYKANVTKDEMIEASE
jgi:OmcA/MtrC family decaheme c-type cytochrome